MFKPILIITCVHWHPVLYHLGLGLLDVYMKLNKKLTSNIYMEKCHKPVDFVLGILKKDWNSLIFTFCYYTTSSTRMKTHCYMHPV